MMSDMASDIDEAYEDKQAALDMRRMHLMYESVRDTGGTVVLPSSLADAFGDDVPEDVEKLLKSIG